MTSSISNLVNNIAEGIYKIKCKNKQDDKKCETYGIKYKYYDCFFSFTNFKGLLWNINVYFVTTIIKKSFMKS